jgi:hypothetical protein
MQDIDQTNRGIGEGRYEAKLDRIEEEVRSLAGEEVPKLKREVEELRKLLLDAGYGQEI